VSVSQLLEAPCGQVNGRHGRSPSEQTGEEAAPLRLRGLDLGTRVAAVAPHRCGHGAADGRHMLPATGPSRLSAGAALRRSAHMLISLLRDTPGGIGVMRSSYSGGYSDRQLDERTIHE